MKRVLLAIAALSFVLQNVCCNKPLPAEAVLHIEDDTLTAEPEGGEFTVRYSVDNPKDGVELIAVPSEGWVSVVSSQNGEIKISVQPNEEESSRETSVEVMYDTQEGSFMVIQKGKKPDDPEDPDDPSDEAYELSYDIDGPMVRMNVKPKDRGKRFFFHYFESSATQGEDIETMIQALVDRQIELGEGFGMSVEEVMNALLSVGESYKDYVLKENTGYVGFACGVDDSGKIGDDTVTKDFMTGAVSASDNQLSISISAIGYSQVDYSVGTTNNDPYAFVVVDPSEWNLETAQEIVQVLVDEGYTLEQRRGDTHGTMNGLTSGTRHFAIAFGYMAGKVTTDIIVEEFYTKGASEPETAEFVFSVSDITDQSSKISVTCRQTDVKYYFDNASADNSLQDIRNYWNATLKGVMDSGMSLTDYWQGKLYSAEAVREFTGLSSGTEYFPYAFAVDPVTGKPSTDIIAGQKYSTL